MSHGIFMAGVNHGIAFADAVLLDDPEGKVFKQAPEIHTGNPEFLVKLNTPGGEEGVKYMTLSTPHDYFYSMNEQSPFVDGADNRVVPYKGHWQIRDSDESFQLYLAFLEGRENSLSLGKALFQYPDRPFGEWNNCADCTIIQRYAFTEDGKVSFFDGKSTKEGKYTFSTSYPANLIDITFPEGTYYGLYRLNANGDGMMMKLGTVDGMRPKDYRYPDLYSRTLKKDGSEKELAGTWKSIDSGFYLAFGVTEYILNLTEEGNFKISGKTMAGQAFESEGKFAAEKMRDQYRMSFAIGSTNFPLLPKNSCFGAVAKFKDGKLLLEHPVASKGSLNPQVVDNPIILEKSA